MNDKRLKVSEIEEFLEKHVEAVLSSRRTAKEPAELLFLMNKDEQDFAFKWIEIMASTNGEMAYQFASYVSQVLPVLGKEAVEEWAIQSLDIYDRVGLLPAIQQLKNIDHFSQIWKERESGVYLQDKIRILEAFVQGLSGRSLKIEGAGETYTDSQCIYLPVLINQFQDIESNFTLYKAIVAHQWAQTRFGTWSISLTKELAHYKSLEKAFKIFHVLETIRLDACLARELPGLSREILRLLDKTSVDPFPETWKEWIGVLESPDASVKTSIHIISKVINDPIPKSRCYQGEIFPDRVEVVKALRVAREKEEIQVALAQLMNQYKPSDVHSVEHRELLDIPFKLNKVTDEKAMDGFRYELFLDGQPIAPPEDVQQVMTSIIQDLSEIPEDYLVPAGEGRYAISEEDDQKKDTKEVKMGNQEKSFLYNEWDYKRQHFKKDWCVLRELEMHPWHSEFVNNTLKKYKGLIKNLRKTFEALRGEDKVLKRQYQGDDVDIDALVESYADTKSGLEMSEKLFIQLNRVERNIAVLLMVDMSGSTKGWINTAEREALVLLCETLESLGDRYSIYGFSGMTRKRCDIFKIKTFDEPYNKTIEARISGIEPQDYTRMGVAIRHLTYVLNQIDARTRLLITLSDGKPDDYDGYRGKYGIEDTRHALIEAKQQGIHPFCITIDREANDYIGHMYGAVNYAVVDDVRKLPLKVSDIYRKLTS
ncbi:MAG TPA: nitric oxide reductase activation protein [Spirochaetes bacterium]|nr:nitric oxide reductase activation protein [Spirochaetota bacterium]